jgi:hypothetical protein
LKVVRSVFAVVRLVNHQQGGVHVMTQSVASVRVLVVAVIDRVGHLVRQALGLPGPLGRQCPGHGLQQQAEHQEPGGQNGFHRAGFYRLIPWPSLHSVQSSTAARSLNTFITQRRQGRIGWRTLFWRDLLLIGTSLNVLMTGTALALLSQGVPAQWALLAHLLPLPYNLFIVYTIGSAPQRPTLVLGASVCWLVLFVLV